MRPVLIILAAACAGAAAASDALDGWQIDVDLPATRQSAGAQWIRNRIARNLLARELLPGLTADALLQCGEALCVTAPSNGAWSNAAWTVEGDWGPEILTALNALPAAGTDKDVLCFAQPVPEHARDRLPAAGIAPDPELSVRVRRDTRGNRPLYVARDGNRLHFAAAVPRLSHLNGLLPGRSARAAAALGVWLKASWSPSGSSGGVRRIEVTLRDGLRGALCVDMRLEAADNAAAEQGARSVAGLLRMLENMNDDRVTSRVRDSLKVMTEGTTVAAAFEVPADALGVSESERDNGTAAAAR